jgi:hypothetical protein
MGFFEDLFGGQSGMLFGKSHKEWADKLGVGEDELQNMIGSLSRNVGTTQREGINRVGEVAAGHDLPVAAQLAMERGVQSSADQAITQGTAGIEQYGSQANRDAWQAILSGESQEAQIQAQKDMQDDDWWGDLIGGVGGALPLLLL